MSDILRTAARFRQDLIHRHDYATREMARAYTHLLDHLNREIHAVLSEMERLQKNGQVVKTGWLYRERRLQRLRAQIVEQVRVFAGQADDLTASEQRLLSSQALSDGAELISRQDPGISVAFDRVPHNAITHLVAVTSQPSPLRELFESIGPDLADDAGNTLMRGVATGQPVRVIARDLDGVLHTGFSRAVTISRTETMRAYRESSRTLYEAHSDVVQGWFWKCFGDACPSCYAQSGSYHPVGETMDTHPNCRCVQIPAVKGSDLTVPSGPDEFARLPGGRQREILGESKWQLYHDGRITLQDLVTRTESRKWGPGSREATIAEALDHARERRKD